MQLQLLINAKVQYVKSLQNAKQMAMEQNLETNRNEVIVPYNAQRDDELRTVLESLRIENDQAIAAINKQYAEANESTKRWYQDVVQKARMKTDSDKEMFAEQNKTKQA